MKIPSGWAYALYSILMVACYVWATYKPDAPYEVFAWSFTTGFGGYLGKRLIQKKAAFSPCNNGNGVVGGGE
jgi:hypothetical protein